RRDGASPLGDEGARRLHDDLLLTGLDLNRALLDRRHRTPVATVLDEPRPPAHGGRAAPPAGAEATLAAAPQPPALARGGRRVALLRAPLERAGQLRLGHGARRARLGDGEH